MLRVFLNEVLRKIFGLNKEEIRRDWIKYLLRGFTISASHEILFGVSKSVRCADFGTWHDRYEERRNA
jgi:hypothetical protein